MENNIHQHTQTFNTAIVESIVKTSRNCLKKQFSKIAITTILVGAVIYILKTSGFISKVKKFTFSKGNTLVNNVAKTISTEVKPTKKVNVSPEIRKICEKAGCEPEDLFKVSKEDYDSLVDHVKSTYEYKDRVLYTLERYSEKDADGNVFFIGEEGLAAYSHSIISSQYQEGEKHALAGHYIDKLIRVPINHEFFPEVKDMGGPAPRVKDAYAISYRKFKQFVERKAREEYGDNANHLYLIHMSIEGFKKALSDHGHKVEDCDYKVLAKLGEKTYILLPEDAKEKYCDCLYMSSANKTAIDIEDISNNSGYSPKDIVTLSKESYKKLIDKVESCRYKSILMPMLEEHALTGESDNVFFAGDTAISALCKALVSSERVKHPLAGYHPGHLLHINARHELFNSLRKMNSSISLIESEYIVNISGVKDIVKKKALELYKEGAEWTWFNKLGFDNFKTRALQDSDFTLVQEIDDSFFVALAPGSKEKFPDINIYPAKPEE